MQSVLMREIFYYLQTISLGETYRNNQACKFASRLFTDSQSNPVLKNFNCFHINQKVEVFDYYNYRSEFKNNLSSKCGILDFLGGYQI